ncbi:MULTISPECIES: hypothetical protein [Sphingobacterium]|uniref:hypothetical protein n=1 Tax=Sphingobacterium TaxID=28453 RepID=UPI00257D8C2B|nr:MULTISPECIES: hypothetical protein [Sphingobacterium]
MDKDNQFMDFLFNEFLMMERKFGKSRSYKYLTIISKYIEVGFSYNDPEKAQQYACMTYSSILYAIYNWKTHLLDLKGKDEEGVRFARYKKRLKKMGYSEDEIANLLIDRFKLNNPTEIISPYGQL